MSKNYICLRYLSVIKPQLHHLENKLITTFKAKFNKSKCLVNDSKVSYLKSKILKLNQMKQITSNTKKSTEFKKLIRKSKTENKANKLT